ncbi:carboxylesterase/lipase family protein [Thermoflavifilum thermophilum]|uniref:Carboxylic ester hydrolase n=1 Tax=Thermoflavifilum thermophilum TaxID=1393122 RepID=A0A1I7NAT5_9BACT|nr:carboxylesterase family protein [Thermoflavifilum thermophilum]SFV31656.1 para-nitrobenzyl esterase [Thermoflavifilum thermophilum]
MLSFRKSIYITATLLISLPAAHAQSQSAAAQAPVVRVTGGMIAGISDPKHQLHIFLGIPYAAPPVGELRWREPQPVKPWNGVKSCIHFGHRPMQKRIFGDMRFRSDTTSEDCLYLNVWAPAHPGKSPLPVLVYFYGGGFIAGDGSEWRYDGASLAQKGIVVVTVNYRLGIFGFFAHPELTRESPHHASGNYGLLDQQAALQWVHDNIAAFGGDPKRVTIAGESAGSVSVCAQMASPLSKHLIAGAIGESGAMIKPTIPAVPLAEAEAEGLRFAERVGAHSLQELRAIPAEKLLDEASQPGAFRVMPCVDGYFFPQTPDSIFAAGQQAHVPLLVGWNSTEVPYVALMQGKAPMPENYASILHELFGAEADEAMRVFPGHTEEEVVRSATELASDRFIVYSTWKWAQLHRTTSQQPVYEYIFSHPRPAETHPQPQTQSPNPPPLKGAGHSWEIEYALGNLATNPVYAWTPEDYQVSRMMENYFAQFIKTGNPNGQGLPEWPANRPGKPVYYMHIDVRSGAMPETPRQRAQFMFLDQWYKTH